LDLNCFFPLVNASRLDLEIRFELDCLNSLAFILGKLKLNKTLPENIKPIESVCLFRDFILGKLISYV